MIAAVAAADHLGPLDAAIVEVARLSAYAVDDQLADLQPSMFGDPGPAKALQSQLATLARHLDRLQLTPQARNPGAARAADTDPLETVRAEIVNLAERRQAGS